MLKAFTSNPLIATGNIAISNSHICMLPDSDFFQTLDFFNYFFGLNLLFFRYLSKIDAPAHLRLYFKHICVVSLFSDFSNCPDPGVQKMDMTQNHSLLQHKGNFPGKSENNETTQIC